jgi:hypothetical protein
MRQVLQGGAPTRVSFEHLIGAGRGVTQSCWSGNSAAMSCCSTEVRCGSLAMSYASLGTRREKGLNHVVTHVSSQGGLPVAGQRLLEISPLRLLFDCRVFPETGRAGDLSVSHTPAATRSSVWASERIRVIQRRDPQVSELVSRLIHGLVSSA